MSEQRSGLESCSQSGERYYEEKTSSGLITLFGVCRSRNATLLNLRSSGRDPGDWSVCHRPILIQRHPCPCIPSATPDQCSYPVHPWLRRSVINSKEHKKSVLDKMKKENLNTEIKFPQPRTRARLPNQITKFPDPGCWCWAQSVLVLVWRWI